MERLRLRALGAVTTALGKLKPAGLAGIHLNFQ
jgi:hypothetical protein